MALSYIVKGKMTCIDELTCAILEMHYKLTVKERVLARGRKYPIAISTVCWYRSCSRTMKPVESFEAKSRIRLKAA